METIEILLRIWFIYWLVFKVYEILRASFIRFQNVLKEGK